MMTPELAWLVIIGSGYRAMLADLTPSQVVETKSRYLDQITRDSAHQLDISTLVGLGNRPPAAPGS